MSDGPLLSTSSTASSESQCSPPEMPRVSSTDYNFDLGAPHGKFLDRIANVEDAEMHGTDPFGLDDILNFPSQF